MDKPVLQKAIPLLKERVKLIGILMDGDSKAIVEDIDKQRVHFLSRGESFGAALLKDIRKDKVIFEYDNKLIEMTF